MLWAFSIGLTVNLGLPLGDLERHLRYFDSPTPDPVLAAVQAGLIAWGFWIAVKILRHRGHRLFGGQFGGQFGGGGAPARLRLLPMFVFVAGMTGYHVWLLTRDMVMRM